MPDVFTAEKRSEVMSRIRSFGNKDTELRMVVLMRAARITGWRRHVQIREARRPGPVAMKPLTVRPDFMFRTERVAVFIDGCFWHGCPRHATRPKQNRKFWDAKLARNQARDRAVTRALKRSGWKVLRLWECALSVKRATGTVRRLERALGRQVCEWSS